MSMQRFLVKYGLIAHGFAVLSGLVSGSMVSAQITPDATLPVGERSQISGNPVFQIDGGAIRGTNLFHSFSQFALTNGQTAFFNNAPTITNIFSRVTGGALSNIDGVLQSNGTANLFFMNPNGIVFGPNARLQIGGSFVATTANAIQFGNQGFFSATNPEIPSLLTVNPSALWFNQTGASAIVHQATTGFNVVPGRSQLLVGGHIQLENAQIQAPAGNIELVSITGNGAIQLSQNQNRYQVQSLDNQTLSPGNITLTQNSVVNTTGIGGGHIRLFGKNVTLSAGSQLQAITFGNQSGNGIQIDASESVEVVGIGFKSLESILTTNLVLGNSSLFSANPNTGIVSITLGSGSASDIKINAKHLILRDGAFILSTALAEGIGGEIAINASHSVTIDASSLVTSTLLNATGSAGDITIQTPRLNIQKGGILASLTASQGRGGDITLQVPEYLEVNQNRPDVIVPTGVYATTRNPTGVGGNLSIDTRQLVLKNGARVLTITGSNLAGTLSDGGIGGDLLVKASHSIEINGLSPGSENNFGSSFLGSGTEGSGQAGNIWIESPVLQLTGGIIFASTADIGNAGDLSIQVDVLTLQEGGIISAASFGEEAKGDGGNLTITATDSILITGKSADGSATSGIFADSNQAGIAGDIDITTPKLVIQNGAMISTESANTKGGNITLNVRDLLLLRRGALISTTAGTAQAGGDGGNITINAPNGFVVAVLNENSDIRANAFNGKGGNINITAQGIYGLKFQPVDTPFSDITASSRFGVNGSVLLNTPNLDPSQGLSELPIGLVDATDLINQSPCQGGGEGEFVVTGRGGIPEAPNTNLNADATWEDWRISDESQSSTANLAEKAATIAQAVVEAQEWVQDRDGNIWLVAASNTPMPRSLWFQEPNCRSSIQSAPSSSQSLLSTKSTL